MFGMKQPVPFEVFNDRNGELVNLYRCVKYHCGELQRELDFMLNSRESFFDCISQNESRGLTDIQRAARYFIMIRHSFGADLRSFATGKSNYIKVIEFLPEVSKRLERTIIENLDFEQLIKTYDRPDALFYLDPPYHSTEKYYAENFPEADHVRLRNVLGNINGKFVLSYNNDEFIKGLYEGYNIKEVSRKNNLSTVPGAKFEELIVKNY